MPHCIHCGHNNVAEASFCQNCGKPFAAQSLPTAPQSRRTAWIAGAALLILAPLGIWLATRPGASTNSVPTPPAAIPVPIGATTAPVLVGGAVTADNAAGTNSASTTSPVVPASSPPAATPVQQHVVVLSDPKGKKPGQTAVPTPLGNNGTNAVPNTPTPAMPGAAVPPPPAPATVQRPAPPPGPSSPREACGARVFLAMQACLQDLCKTPRWTRHSQCVEIREVQRLREQRIRQGND